MLRLAVFARIKLWPNRRFRQARARPTTANTERVAAVIGQAHRLPGGGDTIRIRRKALIAV
jgi:hypothetical protein